MILVHSPQRVFLLPQLHLCALLPLLSSPPPSPPLSSHLFYRGTLLGNSPQSSLPDSLSLSPPPSLSVFKSCNYSISFLALFLSLNFITLLFIDTSGLWTSLRCHATSSGRLHKFGFICESCTSVEMVSHFSCYLC